MLKRLAFVIVVVFLACQLSFPTADVIAANQLKVGVAALVITPYGKHTDWDGGVTDSGVWGEHFTDTNRNSRWDAGEPFEDDPGNTALDSGSQGKYDGIFLAGFGQNRIATGKYDDYWARAIVIEAGATRFAIVSLDVVGYYSHMKYYGLEEVKKLLPKDLGVTDILLTSTHNHEAPDTIGAWGVNPLTDGKYPKYLRFIDRQIARAVVQAARSTVAVRMKLGRTDPTESPSLAGMQTRTGGRPPRFFDEELRACQFVGTTGRTRNRVVATLINWNTHPESMEDKNTMMTSDFIHSIRDEVEKRYGGTAIYLTGDIGAAEIIGDTNTKSNDRSTFDGKHFPLKPENNRPVFTIERTYAIGRDVAKAVFTALDKGEWSRVGGVELKKAELRVPMDNRAYTFLQQRGVLDNPPAGETEVRSWVYLVTIGDAQMITTPGELFPELFYGVETFRRRDCPQADTGRPLEPGVRDRMKAKYKFIIGLCPDEFGYIVPGYDFFTPQPDAFTVIKEVPDPCKAANKVPNHYHETNSASSALAPAWACLAAQLLDGRMPDTAACKSIGNRK